MKLVVGSRCCESCGEALSGPGQTRETSLKARGSGQSRSSSYYCQRWTWSLIFLCLVIPVVLFFIYKDVGELNSDVWLSLAGFIVLTGVLAIYTLRQAGKTWQGVLEDKIEIARGTRLVFLSDQGKRVNIIADSKLADYFKLGDRVVKIRGYDYPELVERRGNLQLCLACGNPYSISDKCCERCRCPTINPLHYTSLILSNLP